jgi:rhodanese-related sulfurtransferase
MNFPPETELEITPAEVGDLRASNVAFRLIDCREPDEWQLCRIAGAELVPLSSFAESAANRFTNPEESIVIHCHHGMRSARAAEWLRSRGFPRTWSMAGGIDLWSETVDPAVPRY